MGNDISAEEVELFDDGIDELTDYNYHPLMTLSLLENDGIEKLKNIFGEDFINCYLPYSKAEDETEPEDGEKCVFYNKSGFYDDFVIEKVIFKFDANKSKWIIERSENKGWDICSSPPCDGQVDTFIQFDETNCAVTFFGMDILPQIQKMDIADVGYLKQKLGKGFNYLLQYNVEEKKKELSRLFNHDYEDSKETKDNQSFNIMVITIEDTTRREIVMECELESYKYCAATDRWKHSCTEKVIPNELIIPKIEHNASNQPIINCCKWITCSFDNSANNWRFFGCSSFLNRDYPIMLENNGNFYFQRLNTVYINIIERKI